MDNDMRASYVGNVIKRGQTGRASRKEDQGLIHPSFIPSYHCFNSLVLIVYEMHMLGVISRYLLSAHVPFQPSMSPQSDVWLQSQSSTPFVAVRDWNLSSLQKQALHSTSHSFIARVRSYRSKSHRNDIFPPRVPESGQSQTLLV